MVTVKFLQAANDDIDVFKEFIFKKKILETQASETQNEFLPASIKFAEFKFPALGEQGVTKEQLEARIATRNQNENALLRLNKANVGNAVDFLKSKPDVSTVLPLLKFTTEGYDLNLELVNLLIEKAGNSVHITKHKVDDALRQIFFKRCYNHNYKLDEILAIECKLSTILIDWGADVDVKDPCGNTFLKKLVGGPPRIPTIKMLIDAGANVNAKCFNGTTPFLSALKYKYSNTEPSIKLYSGKITFNQKGKTLSDAAKFFGADTLEREQQKAIEVLLMLINAGADIMAVDDDNNTPLMIALDRDWNDLEGPNCRNLRMCYPLLSALDWDRINMVNWLLNQGVDVNAVRNDGETALSLTMRYLVKPMAAHSISTEMLKIMHKLLDLNVDVNAALHLAIEYGNLLSQCLPQPVIRIPVSGIIKKLIEAQPNFNGPDKNGMTALGLALHKGYDRVTKLLIEAGASLANVKNGITAIDLAKHLQYNEDRIKNLFGSEVVKVKIDYVNHEELAALRNLPANTNMTNNDPNQDILEEFCLKHIANPDAKDQDVKNLLDVAEQHCSKDMVAKCMQKMRLQSTNSILGKRSHDNRKEDNVVKQQKTSDVNHENTLQDNNESMGLQEPPMTSEGQNHSDFIGQESAL